MSIVEKREAASAPHARIQLAAPESQIIHRLAASLGIDPVEALSAATQTLASQAGEQMREAIQRATAGRTELTQLELQTKIDEALDGLDERPVIAVIRLGARTEDSSTPYPRQVMGADIEGNRPEELWGATRGIWDIGTKASVLVASRFGVPLAVYGGIRWSRRDPAWGGRRYAVAGHRVDGKTAYSTEEGAMPIGASSEAEQRIQQVLAGVRLVMPEGARNPVAYV